jgi:methionyl-tRNA formyltransferase
MDKGLDTGPILAQRSVPIGPEETHPELSERLGHMGAALLAETLPLWLRGEIEPAPQSEEGATLTHTLKKEDGLIEWQQPAGQIARRVRALQPWPGTYTYWKANLLKILRVRVVEALGGVMPLQPGTLSVLQSSGGKALAVWTGDGLLELLDVQMPGKAAVKAQALLSGYPQIAGSVLGA